MIINKFEKSNYDNTSIKDYVKASAVTGALLLIGGTAVTLGIYHIIDICSKEETPIVYTKEDDKEFGIGEHIIAVPIDDPRYEVKEYETHIGYTPVGISSSAYGRDNNLYGDGYILYENNCEVIVHPTGKTKDGKNIYDDFGYPIEYVESEETVYTIEYQPGEHVISVPLSSYQEDLQFDFYDGYEPVGIATTAYGKDGYHPGGGCILYTNTETVEKEKDSTEVFGIPKEEQKQKDK